MKQFHTPVLLQEAVSLLHVTEGKKYIDATVGGGGHTFEILKRGGVVLGIDCDQDAIDYVKKILRDKDIKILSEKKVNTLNISVSQYPNITLVRGNFRDIDTIACSQGFDKVAGILFDLGVSSYQFEQPHRGFSFQLDAPLDGRMDQTLVVGAKDLVNALNEQELYELISTLGEERLARPISRSIIRARRVKPIETTGELARIVQGVYKEGGRKTHPATRVFQAFRIAVNDELNNLTRALPKAVDVLKEEGRLVIIAFHSLEDRIVKRQFAQLQRQGVGVVITKKPIIPSQEEVAANRRSRSAKLRAFEKA